MNFDATQFINKNIDLFSSKLQNKIGNCKLLKWLVGWLDGTFRKEKNIFWSGMAVFCVNMKKSLKTYLNDKS